MSVNDATTVHSHHDRDHRLSDDFPGAVNAVHERAEALAASLLSGEAG